MDNEHWSVGRISITAVEELGGWSPVDLFLEVLPQSTRKELEAIDWLCPDYFDGQSVNALSVHALLVETPAHRILVDPGVGNGKTRIAPALDHLDTDFLERLERVWAREQVDLVLSTHLHVDHVGWNTMLINGEWVPTFPQAQYCFVREEYEHWETFDARARARYSEFGYSAVDAEAVFEDSLRPIADAGLVRWVAPGEEVVPGVSLLGTPGHTPGQVAILLEDGGESAVITGDLLHTQAQIARPDWSVEMDTDPRAAADTRRRFLDLFADSPTLVLGTHFGAPSGGRLVRDGDSIRLVPVRQVVR